MNKEQLIEFFNKILNKDSISFDKELIPLISQYLTDINYKNSEKLISLIVQNPHLSQQCISTIVDYYERKYTILSIFDRRSNKTLVYYA